MAPHLLSLSGEIRNMIYEYVLTEDDGICYREDARGVGWLCTYHIGKDIKSEDSFEFDSDFEDNDLDDEDFGGAAFTNGAFRNAVLSNAAFSNAVFDDEYLDDATAKGMRKAITSRPESDGQECLPTDESVTTNPEKSNGMASIEPGNYTVASQLQFVSRKLRNETKGLVLRYNTITFAESGVHHLRCGNIRVRVTKAHTAPRKLELQRKGDFGRSPSIFWTNGDSSAQPRQPR